MAAATAVHGGRAFPDMNQRDEPPITITQDDISEANRLSLHCPICAGAVEQYVDGDAVIPILCTGCGTLYHKACWDQNGGKCAILGCESRAFRRHGVLDLGPVLKIDRQDIRAVPAYPPSMPAPAAATSSSTQKLKKSEQQMHKEVQRRFRLRDLFEGLLRAIRLWPSDPS